MRVTITPTGGEPQVYEADSMRYEGESAADQVCILLTSSGELRFPLSDNWIEVGD